MRAPVRHRIAAVVVLLCFVLSSGMLTGGVVLCEHADGDSRIEWARCTDGDDGCQRSCDGSDPEGDGQPLPCKDTPLEFKSQLTKSAPRLVHHAAPQPPPSLCPGTPWPPTDLCVARSRRDDRRSRGRPPDAVLRLRTVLLLV